MVWKEDAGFAGFFKQYAMSIACSTVAILVIEKLVEGAFAMEKEQRNWLEAPTILLKFFDPERYERLYAEWLRNIGWRRVFRGTEGAKD